MISTVSRTVRSKAAYLRRGSKKPFSIKFLSKGVCTLALKTFAVESMSPAFFSVSDSEVCWRIFCANKIIQRIGMIDS